MSDVKTTVPTSVLRTGAKPAGPIVLADNENNDVTLTFQFRGTPTRLHVRDPKEDAWFDVNDYHRTIVVEIDDGDRFNAAILGTIESGAKVSVSACGVQLGGSLQSNRGAGRGEQLAVLSSSAMRGTYETLVFTAVATDDAGTSVVGDPLVIFVPKKNPVASG